MLSTFNGRSHNHSSFKVLNRKLKRGIVQAVNPFLFRFMPVTKNTSWVGEQAVPAEARVPKIDLLDASEDAYGGVIVDMKGPMNSDLFVSALRASTTKWREQGKKGIWIKLPIELVNLVEAAVKEGFRYHHAEPSYLMLVKWIPITANTLPANASHRVGIGAFVTNSKGEVLVVQENSGKFKGTGVWKFPTGAVDEGEDICTAAMREVREETGIETEFLEVLAFRQSHNSFFGKSDLFFVCMLKPSSFDIQKQDSEIAAAKWMPLEEYAAQPFIQKHEQFNYIAKACLEKKKGNYAGFSAVPTTTAFSRKQNYLYFNNKDLSGGTNTCENSHPGQHPSLKFEPTTPLSENRKRPAPSPASSANSVIGENSIPLPKMDRTQNDLDMWSYVNTEKFIHIMVEVARREEATNSKKTRQFNDLQWHEILRELGVTTGRIGYTIPKIREKFSRIKKEYKAFKHILDQSGFGWDEASQTVTAPDDVWQTYLQAHPKAGKFRNQGLDHFEELDELLSSSLANGAFARPNTQPPPTRDEEVVMYGKGKPIKREDSVSMGKRKSDGSGGSTAKATKFERREEAYEKFAFSQQMKGEYYQKKAQNQTGQNNPTMKECHAFLKTIKHIIGEDRYLDAFSHLVDHPPWQASFLELDADERMAWTYRKH